MESVQQRANRFVTGDYANYTTGSMMVLLDLLSWQSLENRKEVRLVLLYKVIHGMVAVSLEEHIQINTSATRAKNLQRLKVFVPKLKFAEVPSFPDQSRSGILS